jgi:hypothetical protein
MLQNIPAYDHDRLLLLYTACIADAILQPLYQFIQRKNLYGYVDTLHEIARWAIEFGPMTNLKNSNCPIKDVLIP